MNMSRAIGTLAAVIAVLLTACSPPPAPKAERKAAPPVYYKVDPATAGLVSGKVTFSGKRPPRKKVSMDEDPQCAKLHPSAVYDESVAASNGALANVFVYVKGGLEGKKFEPPAQPAVIDQKGCWFHPRVLGIESGQTLEVTNSDPVTHSIHPRARVNREWNQNQPEGAPALKRRFAGAEVMIPVKCNIHPWMHSWIGVVDHPYFAVTGADGSFQLPNLPPGNYIIEAWHETLGAEERQVTVGPSGKVEIAFAFKGE
jgi:hypothetical protein